MRPIDADTLIDKSYWHGELPTYDNPFPHGRDAVDVEDIENAPTIDAVAVVRCKDCSNRDTDTCPAYQSIFGDMYDEDFCSFGVRKEVQE